MGHQRQHSFSIEDKSARQYRVSFLENRQWHLKVWDGAVRVAYAHCHIDPPVLYVDDLQIANNALRPETWRNRFLSRLQGRRNEALDYRNRGIGRALIHLIAKLAIERKLTAVEGSLSRHDVIENPDLPGWYRRLGFAILPGGRYGCGMVRLELASIQGVERAGELV